MLDNKIKIAQFGLYFPHYREDLFKILSKNDDYLFHFYGDQNFKGGFNLLKPCNSTYNLIQSKVIKIKIIKKKIFIIPSAFFSLLKGNYDIYILSNRITEFPALLTPLFTTVLKRKIILWGHGKINRNSTTEYVLRKMLIKSATACLFYNDNEKNFWINNGIKKEKLFVAKNTVNTETILKIKNDIRNEELERFAVENNLVNKKILIFSARLLKEKNPLFIIEIILKLKYKIPNILALIIGDGPLMNELESKIKERSLESNVRLLGQIYDEIILAKYFLNSHAYIIPSAAGLSLLHAFCYGLPVITDNDMQKHGPEIEALVNGENGFVCEKNDIEDFIEKIHLVLTDEDLRKKLSKNAIKTILQEYNINNMVKGFYHMFSQININSY